MEATMSPKSLNTRPVMPLSLVAPGETVEVVELRVPDAERQRLHELGLLPGVSVRVVKSDASTGLILALHQDGRLALNRGTAHKLLVSLKNGKD